MCTVLLGTLNIYLLACDNTLILANHSRATALTSLGNKGPNEISNYGTTTPIPRDREEVATVSTTVGSEINATTQVQKSLSNTTTHHPNIRGQNSSTSSPNNESLIVNTTSPETLYNVTNDLYSTKKDEPPDYTGLYVGGGLFIIFVIAVAIKFIKLPCRTQKETIIPEEKPPIDREAKRIIQNRNSWANASSVAKNLQFQPPPPPSSARLQIKELSQPGGLDKLKKIRESKRAQLGNERLRKQMKKLREKTINLESTN
tara:strand:- start:1075 stop:1851 length:777 start_codon:yes stop_codon:yes gene_type:complete